MSGSETGSISGAGRGSYGALAAKGSFINTAQWFANKVATAVSMLVIARFLVPEDYGVANQALAIAQFMIVFLPLTMGDVLIAHPRELESLVPTARRLALLIGCGTTLVMLATIPLLVRVYDGYPALWLGGLIAVAALRPSLDALLMVSLARMRVALQYRRIALIDGLVQLGATGVSLVMAALGLRGASLVAPQVVGAGFRAMLYRRAAPTPTPGRFDGALARMLLKAYVPAASGQYLHNVIVMLEVLVLGYVAGDYQTGLFAFAFQVAAQANTVVAYQLGVVLQPIFGHLRDDPDRQVAGFLRVQRVLGLVCVPISIAQVVVAEPLFRLAFPEKYAPAVPVFQVISLTQAFYFATAPSMSCLRSQRRFRTFMIWQGVQFLISVPVYAIGARSSGAVGVSIASAALWAASAPVVVWLCTRPSSAHHLSSVLSIFTKPWLISVPVFAGAWLVSDRLAQFGTWGDLVSSLMIVPLATVLAVIASRWIDPEMRTLLDKARSGVRDRFRRMRGREARSTDGGSA